MIRLVTITLGLVLQSARAVPKNVDLVGYVFQNKKGELYFKRDRDSLRSAIRFYFHSPQEQRRSCISKLESDLVRCPEQVFVAQVRPHKRGFDYTNVKLVSSGPWQKRKILENVIGR